MPPKSNRRNARITAIANQKGGVGKTTTAHALVAGLTLKGYKALAVDLDPQRNLTYTLNPETGGADIYALMKGKAAADAIRHTPQGDIIPGSLDLIGADLEFNKTGREYILSKRLDPLRPDYDYVIIDSPPTLGILTVNALTAADDIIIPLGADAYSINGFELLYENIGTVKEICNQKLKIAGLLITRHNERTNLGRDVKKDIEETARQMKTLVFKTVIRESVTIRETQMTQSNLYAAKNNNAVIDYLNFVTEYIKGAK